MCARKPVFDSFRTPIRGKETTEFLKEERHLLKSKGWVEKAKY